MAKDPAMLWYWSDWNSGTALLTRFLKGCYMDLLHAQFNHGRLSLEEIKICLGSDFGTAWPALQKKFKKDETNLFFNERLEVEKQKRAAFTESRRNNLKSDKEKPPYEPPYENHMGSHMENVNVNTNTNKKRKRGAGEKPKGEPIYVPDENEFMDYCLNQFPENYEKLKFAISAKYKSWVENNWHDGKNQKILNWKTKILNTIPYLKENGRTTTNTKISQQSGIELAEAIAKSAIEVNNRIARSKEQSTNVSENNT